MSGDIFVYQNQLVVLAALGLGQGCYLMTHRTAPTSHPPKTATDAKSSDASLTLLCKESAVWDST